MAKINTAQYQVGAVLRAASARVKDDATKPPSYYTEASLLDDMREAYKFALSEADREMLKLTNGIGTARTRGDAIKDLIKSEFIVRSGRGKKQILKDSQAGRSLSTIAPAAMKNVAMTAKWEMLFSRIEKGELDPAQFKQVIRKFVTAIVDNARQQKTSGK